MDAMEYFRSGNKKRKFNIAGAIEDYQQAEILFAEGTGWKAVVGAEWRDLKADHIERNIKEQIRLYKEAILLYEKAVEFFSRPGQRGNPEIPRANAKKAREKLSGIEETSERPNIPAPPPIELSTLYILSCSKQKIWDIDDNADDYVPAQNAYTGLNFIRAREWLKNNKPDCYWFILSGKHGFMEPFKPIDWYDIHLIENANEAISTEELKRQLKQKRRWKGSNGLTKEIKIEDFKDVVALNFTNGYFDKIEKIIPNINRQDVLVNHK